MWYFVPQYHWVALEPGLYTCWSHRIALIIGWAEGMAYGTVQAYRTPGDGQAHFGALCAVEATTRMRSGQRARISRRYTEPIGGQGPSHPTAGPPTRQGGPAATGRTATRITEPYTGYEY